jgi:hypothetical protein
MTMRPAESPEEQAQVVDRDASEASSGGVSDAMVLALICFGVAGAGVVVGSVTGAMTLSRDTELEAACPSGLCPPEQRDALDEAMLLSEVATAGFAIAAVSAALGVTAVIIASSGDDDAADSATDVALVIGPTAVALRGVF